MSETKQYSIKSTVELFKIAVSKDGNIRYPGIYTPANPLEDELRTSKYCRLISEPKHTPCETGECPLPEPEVEPKSNAESKENSTHTKPETNTKNINSELEVKNLNPATARVQEVEIKPEHKESSFESGAQPIKINETDIQALIDLDGIGKGTAKKVVQFRELSPFANYSDLNERVPLAFGRDWKDFYIEFE